jgi:uncharacterized 2Fe-2S/4Fe-4S cluster protein (DUF4445 family)
MKVALWEKDLASLVRAKAAVFAGIRSLVGSLGAGAPAIDRAIISGNFGRFLNLPAAIGIGLLPGMPLHRFGYELRKPRGVGYSGMVSRARMRP